MEERSLQDRISSLVLEAFRKLPNKCKPQENEWTCLAAVVASTCSDKNLEILTLATGNKCLGICKMCQNGTVINDSHAEVLARRALKLLLWNELIHDLKDSQSKDFSSDNTTKRSLFCWKHMDSGMHVDPPHYHLFVSELPCGDASIVNSDTMSTRNKNDAFQRTGAKVIKLSQEASTTKIVQYQAENQEQQVGLIRSKSGRSDLRPCDRSMSMSCSDKILSWYFGGIQGSLLSHFIKPIYLDSIIIGHHQTGDNGDEQNQIMSAKLRSLNRAIVQRLVNVRQKNISNELEKAKAKHDTKIPSLHVTPIKFEYSRSNPYIDTSDPWVPKNASAVERKELLRKRKRHQNVKKKRSPSGNAMYVLFPGASNSSNQKIECLIGARGVRQGASKKSKSRKTWSAVSKIKFLEYFRDVLFGLSSNCVADLNLGDIHENISNMTYKQIKERAIEYRVAKESLLLNGKFKDWLRIPDSYIAFKIP